MSDFFNIEFVPVHLQFPKASNRAERRAIAKRMQKTNAKGFLPNSEPSHDVSKTTIIKELKILLQK